MKTRIIVGVLLIVAVLVTIGLVTRRNVIAEPQTRTVTYSQYERDLIAQVKEQQRTKHMFQANDNPVKVPNLCGAPTKQGKPCKRRVKLPGTHCFIHK